MNQEQLNREIADFAFWQHTQNECDRGYVRSGNSVMRRALKRLGGKHENHTEMQTWRYAKRKLFRM